mmetsp:Transcript_24991/g.79199  ORF Transcript_24991/g.79199 Transcript_24991/m.79199 type:complete len:255 (+) Transcript_24991:305-1069(+)
MHLRVVLSGHVRRAAGGGGAGGGAHAGGAGGGAERGRGFPCRADADAGHPQARRRAAARVRGADVLALAAQRGRGGRGGVPRGAAPQGRGAPRGGGRHLSLRGASREHSQPAPRYGGGLHVRRGGHSGLVPGPRGGGGGDLNGAVQPPRRYRLPRGRAPHERRGDARAAACGGGGGLEHCERQPAAGGAAAAHQVGGGVGARSGPGRARAWVGGGGGEGMKQPIGRRDKGGGALNGAAGWGAAGKHAEVARHSS